MEPKKKECTTSLNFNLQKGTAADPAPWNTLMQISETIPGYFYFLEKCQRYLHEGRTDQISPWDIFLFLKRERKRERKKQKTKNTTTVIFTSSSLEVLLHLIQTCSDGDPHRTFKVNPIAARRCLGVRVCSSV